MDLILAINPGTSSKKMALFELGELIFEGHFEIEKDQYVLTTHDGKKEDKYSLSEAEYTQDLNQFLKLAEENLHVKKKHISAVGIRLVAPGRAFMTNSRLSEEFINQVKSYQTRAPIHITNFLLAVSEAQLTFAAENVGMFAISDSAFHSGLLHEARNYAINSVDADKFDIYRFGYHGLSAASVVRRLQAEGLDTDNIIICHLGDSASIHAIKVGRSVDTSMGYSPLEGLIMSTRSGDMDVVAALELKKQLTLDDKGLEDYLNNQSGLLGMSGVTSDIRQLLELESTGHEKAALALSSMIYRVVRYIGAYHATLGGVQAIVFTGIVGQRSSLIRKRICAWLEGIGVKLDQEANHITGGGFNMISAEDSKIAVWVIDADETKEVALQTKMMLEDSN